MASVKDTDILNYSTFPFGYGSNDNYDFFIASGSKLFGPYFIETHYSREGVILEVVIINVLKSLINEYGDETEVENK